MESRESSELTELIDRSQIQAVLVRYARGIDRRDAGLVASCFHDDAIENHGTFNGPATEFVGFVMARLRSFAMTSHNLCNIWIESRGSVAVAETYFLALHVYATGGGAARPDLFLAGRYVDRFEKRAAGWKIANRQLICDYVRESALGGPMDTSLGLTKMMQQRPGMDDFVYRRWAELAAEPINQTE
jgi:hypothetical protein